jgi:hypothetical protein
MIAQQSPILEKAANTLLEFSEDEIARDRIRRIKMAEADKRIQIMEARKEGREEVFTLLKKGISVEEVEKMLCPKQGST